MVKLKIRMYESGEPEPKTTISVPLGMLRFVSRFVPANLKEAEHAFHAHPLGHNDFLWIDPLVVGVAFGLNHFIQGFPLVCSEAHDLLLYPAGSINGGTLLTSFEKIKTLKPATQNQLTIDFTVKLVFSR